MKKFHKVLPIVIAWIENESGDILLGLRPDVFGKPYPLKWDMPGGRLENEETVEEGLIREVLEETGYDVKVSSFHNVHHNFGETLAGERALPALIVCLKVEIVGGELNPSELEDMSWVSKEEMKSLPLTPWSAFFLKDL